MKRLIALVLCFSAMTMALPLDAAQAVSPSPSLSRTSRSDHLVSMDFYHADVVDVLRLLAKDMRINLVVDASVRGEVTMTLTNVPARQAFLTVLAINGLDYDWLGNLVVVGTHETVGRLTDAQGHRKIFVGPRQTMEISLDYAQPERIVAQIKQIYPDLAIRPGRDRSVVVTGPSDQLLYVRRLIKGP
jgi:type IV pilus assembly protein PilQ